MPVRRGVLRAAAAAAAVATAVVLLINAAARAQSAPPPAAASLQPKPVTGFVPRFEIMRTVRAAGFDPLAPPLREGTTYVLRAIDYRGILMRVVLDARTGAIRDVTRIVPAASGSLGVVLPPYGPPRFEAPYADSPYGAPIEYELPPPALPRRDEGAALRSPVPMARPPVTHAKASTDKSPPLPRPRPAGLASSRRPAISQKTEKSSPVSEKGPVAASEKTIGNAQPTPSPPAAQAKSPTPVPLSD